MDELSLSKIAEMAGAKILRGDPAARISRVGKDTRSLQAGDLYIALRGANFDGNRFASDAAALGAGAVLLDSAAAASGVPCAVLLAEDGGEAALTRLAAAWRELLKNTKVLCITGSNGKTSTKEFAAAVLACSHRVTKTPGNLNNHIGVPLSILSASTADTAAVWEIAMNHPGETAPLAALARPDAAIITNIGTAHIEYMKTRGAIALEKGMLAEAVSPAGAVFLSYDDDLSSSIAARCRARVVRTGFSGGDLVAEKIIETEEGCSFVVRCGERLVPATLPTHGAHMVANALLALAAGLEFGLELEEAVRGLAGARLVGGRQERRMIRDIIFLDDTYNANPDSMRAALATLRALPGQGHRIAVLGAMGEMGDYAGEGYRRTGEAAGKAVDILITVGAETSGIAQAARDAGLGRVHEVDDKISAARMLGNLARPGDIVLVKGSRSVRMEDILKHFES